jgi:SAM-dependent methyltransferase
MQRFLAGLLVCPACSEREPPLALAAWDQRGDEIVSGALDCPGCGARYPIRDGAAEVLPPWTTPAGAQHRYESRDVVSSYLWAHYGDLAGFPEAGALFRELAPVVEAGRGPLLDAGCAAGRLVFETAARTAWAVGVDLSGELVRAARTLLLEGAIAFDLKAEGRITEPVRIQAPEAWAGLAADFLVADAQALPFPSSVFGSVSSVNLLDKLPRPMVHLRELGRTAKGQGAELLVADPFSWSEDTAEPEHWLGGRNAGPFAGRGMDNLERLLADPDGPAGRPWKTPARGEVQWTLRSHANHRELITSQYLHARR